MKISDMTRDHLRHTASKLEGLEVWRRYPLLREAARKKPVYQLIPAIRLANKWQTIWVKGLNKPRCVFISYDCVFERLVATQDFRGNRKFICNIGKYDYVWAMKGFN